MWELKTALAPLNVQYWQETRCRSLSGMQLIRMGNLLLLHILIECSNTSKRTGNYIVKSIRYHITHNTGIINFTATRFGSKRQPSSGPFINADTRKIIQCIKSIITYRVSNWTVLPRPRLYDIFKSHVFLSRIWPQNTQKHSTCSLFEMPDVFGLCIAEQLVPYTNSRPRVLRITNSPLHPTRHTPCTTRGPFRDLSPIQPVQQHFSLTL
jgi:hypothetical protein